MVAIRGAKQPSSTLAAQRLEVEHAYLSMRPALPRTYAPLPLSYGADGLCAMALGGTRAAPRRLAERSLYNDFGGGEIDRWPVDPAERSLYNDFGGGGIDRWLVDLAARELCVEDATTAEAVGREVPLDGTRVAHAARVL